MKPIDIIVVDDHILVREGICHLLNKNNRFKVVAEAHDGEHLLEILKGATADIVLLDISMPKLNGIETLKILQEKYPQIKVVMLTMHEENEYALKCIKKGAKGYILKNIEPQELYKALELVAEGKTYFDAEISTNLLYKLSNTNDVNYSLTEREIEILQLVVKGLSAKMIGDKLNISQRTVEVHKLNIMKKLNVSNTAELIAKILQEKII